MVGSEDFGYLFVLFLARIIRSISFEFNKCSIDLMILTEILLLLRLLQINGGL